MHDSFKRLLEASGGLTQEEIARRIDESPQTLTNWKSRGVSKSGSLKAAAVFNCSANWIWKGVDDTETQNVYRVTGWDNDTPLDTDEVEIPFHKDTLISCGAGSLSEILNNETRKLRLSYFTLRRYGVDPANALALTAHGNSMSQVINDGATVYVDLGRTTIVDGKIFAISHGGLFKFKYLYRMPKGGVRIVSENSDEYPDEILTYEQIIDQEFEVVAYAFNVQNSLP